MVRLHHTLNSNNLSIEGLLCQYLKIQGLPTIVDLQKDRCLPATEAIVLHFANDEVTDRSGLNLLGQD